MRIFRRRPDSGQRVTEWWNSHQDEVSKYAGLWIALDASGIRASAKTLECMMPVMP